VKDRIALTFPAAPNRVEQVSVAPATIAIWASVSEEADKRIREQISAGVFPLRLKAEDWTSGEIVWLLDVIAPDEKMATEVLKGFRRVAKRDEINVHPVVERLVDRDTLTSLLSKAANALESGALN
jgi:hemolysin-activating ACP:hemolysin acyltransferase